VPSRPNEFYINSIGFNDFVETDGENVKTAIDRICKQYTDNGFTLNVNIGVTGVWTEVMQAVVY
jgi:hypothetical protein